MLALDRRNESAADEIGIALLERILDVEFADVCQFHAVFQMAIAD